ncbi:PspC domain-containing protein [uncultured Eubacterium sp.]|uniref:PspC domain-containing protein n=1 Tax=uncultured Eubacterium sp. TaxID=165185 RepID=UPI00265D5B78|nr:PspC domain-containing protein [uncultured Eubacterium sp.]
MKKKLIRSSSDRMLCGVCGGLGIYFNIDSTIVRLIWAVVTSCSCGTGILAYIIATLIIPNDDIIQ